LALKNSVYLLFFPRKREKIVEKKWDNIKLGHDNKGAVFKYIFGYQNVNCLYFCIVTAQAKYMKKIDCFV
jgi:hypothetical protein